MVVELTLQPCSAALAYIAGHYVLLSDADGRLPQRSYSIANAPRRDGLLTILATRVEGGILTTWVHEGLRPGDEVLLEGPYGTFVPVTDWPLLLLAGGSGLAPMRATAEASLAERPQLPITLFFSACTLRDAIDRRLFSDWQRSHADFRYLLTLTQSDDAPLRGHIPDLLEAAFGSTAGHEVFIAGSQPFVADCLEAVRRLGAIGAQVHPEPFFCEPQPWLTLPDDQRSS
ncbi:MAG: FAD-binding oxidoreductase [Betaproteobacteria bacterium]|nr:FAD-binding oxidoreductase [Betaproteobacteria bacterium]